MKAYLAGSILVLLLFPINGFSELSNISIIAEISEEGVQESFPRISDDELTLTYYRRLSSGGNSTDGYYEATRSSKGDPFGAPSAAAFANVISSVSRESAFWMSSDRLRIYFSSATIDEEDLFYASRASASVPFGPPQLLTELSEIGYVESTPRLTEDERTIYFMANREGVSPARIFKASRASIGDPFGIPTLVSEIDSGYWLFDISADDRVLFTGTSSSLYYSQRFSTAMAFPEPVLLGSVVNEFFTSGQVTSDLSGVYFGKFPNAIPLPSLYDTDLFSADLTLSSPEPTATPTPVPPPEIPAPPELSIVAEPGQIEAHTGGPGANPWAAAFDSEGRYLFFDQEIVIDATGNTIGTNSLIALEEGNPPIFTTLATQAELAAVDINWVTNPYCMGLVALPNESVGILAFGYYSMLYPPKLLKVDYQGGLPATVTSLAELNLAPTDWNISMCYDDFSTPPAIYVANSEQIYAVTPSIPGATPAKILPDDHSFAIGDIRIGSNGELLMFHLSDFYEVDKETGAATLLLENLDSHLDFGHDVTNVMAIRPSDGVIVGHCNTYLAFPPLLSRKNLFKLIPIDPSGYEARDFMIEQQFHDDEALASWISQANGFFFPAKGMVLHPSVNCLYCSNGSYPFSMSAMTYQGTRCILKISLADPASVPVSQWRLLR